MALSSELDFFNTPVDPQATSAADSLPAVAAELDKTADQLVKAIASKEDVEKLVTNLQIDSSTTEDSKDYTRHADQLATYVRSCFDSSEAARKEVEADWLESLKQYKGQYDADVFRNLDINRSKAFVRVTRTKVRTVDSRLSDLLFPANGDKNWDILPTPLPEISSARMNAIIQMYQEENNSEITPDQLEVLVNGESEKRTRKMSKAIADQLSEIRYRETMRDVIHSGNVYGTGILKGPLVSIVENKQYYKHIDDNNIEKWILKDYDRVMPFAEHVRIWDVYPDMEANSFHDCRYIVQRRKMNKHDLIDLTKRADFSGDVINKYLRDNPLGNYTKKDFEVYLQTMGDIISDSDADRGMSRKYEVLEYWGYVDAQELKNWGVDIPESKEGVIEVPANIWVLGDRVIKAALSPMEGIKWPYFVYYFDKDETSIFGEGIPSIMRDMQELINAAFRAMVDNAAISAGPQVEVNEDLISEDEDPRDIHPFKVWLRTGTGLDAANPCLRVFQLPSYTTEFQKMIDIFSNFSDEITTIPRYMWGDSTGGAGRTSSGLSMLMGSANMSIKDQVKNFDDGITTPFIKAMYHWNMQFNDDESIKGDYTVIARGSASLIAKEMYSQYLINFANITANNMDAGIVRRPEIIRSIADSFDLNSDKFVLSPKEIEMREQEAAQKAQEEKQFMSNIIETARKEGLSPEALVTNMRELLQMQNQNMQAAEKMSQPGEIQTRQYMQMNSNNMGI